MAELFDGQQEMEVAVRESFTRALENQEGSEYPRTLQAEWLETPVGTLLAAGDDKCIYLLSFLHKSSMARKAALIQKHLDARMELAEGQAVRAIASELDEYFAGRRTRFETPLCLIGSVFQVRVWEELRTVPFGATITYTDLAERIGKPAAFRAVAQANAQNPIAIAVPCHRVVNADGGLGGYNAGLERKRWLLDFERNAVSTVADKP